MRSILFVCTANICRSPMAEGVLRKLAGEKHVRAEIDSVGTHNYHVGKPPYKDAIESAKRRGYPIEHLVARCIGPADFDRFDMILAMDRANIAHLRTIAPTRSKPKIELLLEYGERFHGKDIPDPYGKQPRDFEIALDMIEDGCKGLVEYLQHTAARSQAGHD